MTLGERLIQLRAKAGLSQDTLAEQLGVSRQSVSKWENDASVPDLEKPRRKGRRDGRGTSAPPAEAGGDRVFSFRRGALFLCANRANHGVAATHVRNRLFVPQEVFSHHLQLGCMAGAFFDFWPQFDVASFRQLCHLDGRLLADHCVVVPDGSNHSPSPARPCLQAASGRLCAPICRYPQHLDVHPSSGSAPVLSASSGWKVPDTVLVGDASSGVRPYHTRIRCFPPAFHPNRKFFCNNSFSY